jgi:hypothetical protein
VIGFLFYGRDLVSLLLAVALLVSGTLTFRLRVGRRIWDDGINHLVDTARHFIRVHQLEILMVGMWLIIPVAVPFVLSFVLTPMYTMRYVLGASPALYLLVAAAIFLVRHVVPTPLMLTAFLIVVLPAFNATYFEAAAKEQWREAAAYVEAHQTEDDIVVIPTFDRPFGFTEVDAFRWYYEGRLPVCQMIYERISELEIGRAFQACSSEHDRIWVILFRDPNFPATPEGIRDYYAEADQPYEPSDRVDFTFISVYLFAISNT